MVDTELQIKDGHGLRPGLGRGLVCQETRLGTGARRCAKRVPVDLEQAHDRRAERVLQPRRVHWQQQRQCCQHKHGAGHGVAWAVSVQSHSLSVCWYLLWAGICFDYSSPCNL